MAKFGSAEIYDCLASSGWAGDDAGLEDLATRVAGILRLQTDEQQSKAKHWFVHLAKVHKNRLQEAQEIDTPIDRGVNPYILAKAVKHELQFLKGLLRKFIDTIDEIENTILNAVLEDFYRTSAYKLHNSRVMRSIKYRPEPVYECLDDLVFQTSGPLDQPERLSVPLDQKTERVLFSMSGVWEQIRPVLLGTDLFNKLIREIIKRDWQSRNYQPSIDSLGYNVNLLDEMRSLASFVLKLARGPEIVLKRGTNAVPLPGIIKGLDAVITDTTGVPPGRHVDSDLDSATHNKSIGCFNRAEGAFTSGLNEVAKLDGPYRLPETSHDKAIRNVTAGRPRGKRKRQKSPT